MLLLEPVKAHVNIDWFFLVAQKLLAEKKMKSNIELDALLDCISSISLVLDDTFASKSQSLRLLLDALFNTGLSAPLVSALQSLVIHLVSPRAAVCKHLIVLIQDLLLKHLPKFLSYRADSQPSLAEDKALPEVMMALTTLATFEFGNGPAAPKHITRLNLIKEVAVPYLACSGPEKLRQAVLLACAKHLVPAVSLDSLKGDGASRLHSLAGHEFEDFTLPQQRQRYDTVESHLVIKITQMMLRVSVSDASHKLRLSTLCSLDNYALDFYLAENKALLMATLNDELLEVKLTGIKITGRLLSVPGYSDEFMPHLLSMFTQLVSILHTGSKVEDSDDLMLMAYFMHYAPAIASGHAKLILQIVIRRMSEPEQSIAHPLCLIIGELGQIAAPELEGHLETVLKALIQLAQDPAPGIRSAAITAICKVAQDTSYVVQPYIDHPELFGVLATAWSSDVDPAVRNEAIRALGIIGTPDPQVLNSHRRGPQEESNVKVVLDSFAMHSKKGSDGYFLVAALNSLIRIANDPSQSVHHTAVFQAMMVIIDFHGTEVTAHLPQLMPSFIHMIRTAHETNMESFLFMAFQFVKVIGFARDSIDSKDAVKMVKIVLDFWQPISPMVELLRAIAVALPDALRAYLPTVLQLLRQTIMEDDSAERAVTTRVVSLLPDFGNLLEGWLDVFIPQIVTIFDNQAIPVEVREDAIIKVIGLAEVTSIRGCAVIIFYPLARAIDENPELRVVGMQLLDRLMEQMGSDYSKFGFHSFMLDIIARNKIPSLPYERSILRRMAEDGYDGKEQFEDDAESKSNYSTGGAVSLGVDQGMLKEAWYISPKASAEDWSAWLERFSGALLKTSPCPALRACSHLAEYLPSLSMELFNVAFVSCWGELYADVQEDLILTMERALKDEMVQNNNIKLILLNLAEFMQFMNRGRMPVTEDVLGYSAYIADGYAKALFYKEREFHSFGASNPQHSFFVARTRRQSAGNLATNFLDIGTSPGKLKTGLRRANSVAQTFSPGAGEKTAEEKSIDKMLSTLIDIMELNNLLRLPQSSVGCMVAAKDIPTLANAIGEALPMVDIKLLQWDQAILQFRRIDALSGNASGKHILSYMRCLDKLFMWDELQSIISSVWGSLDDKFIHMVAPLACSTAIHTNDWDSLEQYTGRIREKDHKFMYMAITAIHKGKLEDARHYIAVSRSMLSASSLDSSLGARNDRISNQISHAQTLCELDEIVFFKHKLTRSTQRTSLKKTWMRRIYGCRQDVSVWHRMLKLRSLVLPPIECCDVQIKFSELCHNTGWPAMAHQAVIDLLGGDPAKGQKIARDTHPFIKYAYIKYLFRSGETDSALDQLHGLVSWLMGMSTETYATFTDTEVTLSSLRARCFHRIAHWKYSLAKDKISKKAIQNIMVYYVKATQHNPEWDQAWVSLAMINYHMVLSQKEQGEEAETRFIIDAIKGFFKAISLNKGDSLQHTLRLLQLWFTYGDRSRIQEVLNEGLASVAIESWLQVIPQFVARMHVPNKAIQQSIFKVLSDVGFDHPRLLITPLLVATRSERDQKTIANKILNQLRLFYPELVEQVAVITDELVRVSFLWHEQWHAALQVASTLFYDESDIDGMVAALEPLHKLMATPQTLHEVAFVQSFAPELESAAVHMALYRESGDTRDVDKAWNYYYTVFQKLSQMLPKLTELHLADVSVRLLETKDTLVTVPGTYDGHSPLVHIASFNPDLQVIASKQRPRKLSMRGSDGREYVYLLKSQEDLRVDERVMAFFGLVNTLLEPTECKQKILRYSVVPIAENAGLIGWVPNCDMLHSLIVQHRKKHNIILHAEHMHIRRAAPLTKDSEGRPTDDGYDQLTVMQKSEIFNSALTNTKGDDLANMLWFTSPDLETWLDRRTTYTTSLAVMSMVGYILGLGDRHPSNMMLDRVSGAVLHIDFGDCFEVAQQRETYPERVPFRLTRILINAFEIGGIEGIFRSTCEEVMHLLRNNKDSLMAVLELFVYDPLLDWRRPSHQVPEGSMGDFQDAVTALQHLQVERSVHSEPGTTSRGSRRNSAGPSPRGRSGPSSRRISGSSRCASTYPSPGPSPDGSKVNEKAVDTIQRVQDKLLGRDFGSDTDLEVPDQVQRLISSATSANNLSVQFMGWCPYW